VTDDQEKEITEEAEIYTHTESVFDILPSLDFPEDGIIKNNETFNVELRQADLNKAFNLIGEMGKVNFLYEGDFTERIGVSFPDVLLDDALHSLLKHHRCTIRSEGGMFVISRTDPDALLSHIFHLKSISAVAYKENLETLLGSTWPPVITPEGNAVMLTAPPQVLKMVAKYLDSVDQPERQVLIEARVMEVVLEDRLELGAELNIRNIHLDDTTSQILSSFLHNNNGGNFTFAGDNSAIDSALRVLKEVTRVEILSRPKVLAKDGKEAKIEVIKEVPYISATTTTTGVTNGVGTNTVQEVEFKEVGLKLVVTPYVRGNDTVELKIVQDASEEMGIFENIPVVDRRLIDTTFVVDNNESIVIGGLIKTQTRDEVSGIPLLMDIPLLGYLFKMTREVTEKRELLILISPKVVRAGVVPDATEGYTELQSL